MCLASSAVLVAAGASSVSQLVHCFLPALIALLASCVPVGFGEATLKKVAREGWKRFVGNQTLDL